MFEDYKTERVLFVGEKCQLVVDCLKVKGIMFQFSAIFCIKCLIQVFQKRWKKQPLPLV